jgi:hypothetical protein
MNQSRVLTQVAMMQSPRTQRIVALNEVFRRRNSQVKWSRVKRHPRENVDAIEVVVVRMQRQSRWWMMALIKEALANENDL